MKKGISPLVATVLLIGVTMALAGVMASWATQFSSTRLDRTNQDVQCIGALDISSLKFDSGVVTLKIRNIGDINLTNLKANLEYATVSLNKADIILKNFNVTDPLNPASTTFLIYNTLESTKPDKIEVFAENCKSYPVALLFK